MLRVIGGQGKGKIIRGATTLEYDSPLERYRMIHDLMSVQRAIQVIEIFGTERHRGNLRLHLFLQCWMDRRFHGMTMIDCCNMYDYCIRSRDFNIIEGGPDIQVTSQHPLLWVNEPHCSLKITTPEEIAKWTGQTAELGMAALFAYHRESVDEFIPFYPALLLKPGQKDFSLYGPKPLLEGYARVLVTLGFHPKVEQLDSHGQSIPGGDGAIYDPPMDLRLLLLDRSWVIAEGFYVHEVMSEQQRPPTANQN